ncbi:hypothetical protein MCOR34_011973, partial [Pyricularia oryzae]
TNTKRIGDGISPLSTSATTRPSTPLLAWHRSKQKPELALETRSLYLYPKKTWRPVSNKRRWKWSAKPGKLRNWPATTDSERK